MTISTTTFFHFFADALTSPAFLTCAASFAALFAACGCGRCGRCDDRDDRDDKDDKDESNDESEFDDDNFDDLELNADNMREYEEFVAQTDARLEELVATLDDYSGDNAQELENELIQTFLTRAVRRQEEDEFDDASDDYAAAFERIDAFREKYGESIDLLKTLAAARLNFAILLNDANELADADAEYVKASEATARLVEFGDRDARLDLIGIRLNRAAIAFELGRRVEALETLDDAAEEFEKLAESTPEKRAEALYYLAKTWTTKADFLRASLNENDENGEAAEAREACRLAIDVYRRLVDAGNTQYKRDLADVIVGFVSDDASEGSQEELDASIDALAEACSLYESVIACGENDACVDLFDASLQRGELLLSADRAQEALKLYDGIIETFDQFSKSDELPLLEGLAVAYQYRATLRKNADTSQNIIPDLTAAIGLQSQIAESLIESLRGEEHSEHSCGCCENHESAEHAERKCCCGNHNDEENAEHSCGCCGNHERAESAEHAERKCCCGNHNDEENVEHSCGCGHCGNAAETERKFLVERWANDNYNALMDCFFERASVYMERRNWQSALADCLAATNLDQAYRAALRPGESLSSNAFGKLRDLKAALRRN